MNQNMIQSVLAKFLLALAIIVFLLMLSLFLFGLYVFYSLYQFQENF